MCVSGSDIDSSKFYGFKVSHNIQSGASIDLNLNKVYYIEDNFTLNPNSSSSSSFSPNLTILNNSLCSCQNVLFKGMYDFSLDSSSAFESANFSAILYRNLTGSCDSEYDLQQIFDLHYNHGNFTFERPNNIGYSKGDKLLVGNAVSNGNSSGIRTLFPFSFNRIDENGLCYLQVNNLSKIADQSKLEFGLNSIFSCDLKMNLAELSSVCLNSTMYNTSLYTNFINYFQQVGIYANSNPLFLQDWVNVTAYFDTSKVIWDTLTNKCTFYFPSLIITHSKIGTQYDVQYKVNDVITVSNQNEWAYSKSNQSEQQTFSLNFIIQFVELPNSLVFYGAPAPKVTPYLSNDVLYPFYDAQSSINLFKKGLFMIVIYTILISALFLT